MDCLCKGVFWVIEERFSDFVFRIPCNACGEITGETEYPLNSKEGINYNHKKLWSVLPCNLTDNKPFDYYPRGRVEIKNGRAVVFLNPDVNYFEVREKIIQFFGLTAENGIKSVRFVSDGSAHYKYKNI
ncbi:MAG: hypothetical protein ACI4MN_02120 [Candidatus Coproplasma sp.]